MEIRNIPASVLAVDLGEDDYGERFAGAAAIYERDLQLWPGATERFATGCFDVSGPLVCTANLGHRFFLGIGGGSLQVIDDGDMLAFYLRRSDCDDDHEHIFEIAKLFAPGSMIAYQPTQVEWTCERGKLVRVIKSAVVEAIGLDFTQSLPISPSELAELRKEAQRHEQKIKKAVLHDWRKGVETR